MSRGEKAERGNGPEPRPPPPTASSACRTCCDVARLAGLRVQGGWSRGASWVGVEFCADPGTLPVGMGSAENRILGAGGLVFHGQGGSRNGGPRAGAMLCCRVVVSFIGVIDINESIKKLVAFVPLFWQHPVHGLRTKLRCPSRDQPRHARARLGFGGPPANPLPGTSHVASFRDAPPSRSGAAGSGVAVCPHPPRRRSGRARHFLIRCLSEEAFVTSRPSLRSPVTKKARRPCS